MDDVSKAWLEALIRKTMAQKQRFQPGEEPPGV